MIPPGEPDANSQVLKFFIGFYFYYRLERNLWQISEPDPITYTLHRTLSHNSHNSIIQIPSMPSTIHLHFTSTRLLNPGSQSGFSIPRHPNSVSPLIRFHFRRNQFPVHNLLVSLLLNHHSLERQKKCHHFLFRRSTQKPPSFDLDEH